MKRYAYKKSYVSQRQITILIILVAVLLAATVTYFIIRDTSFQAVSTPVPLNGTTSTSTNGVLLGVYTGGNNPGKFTALEQAIGHTLAIENQGESFGSDWGTDSNRAGDEPDELKDGITPMISLKLDGGQNNNCVQLQDITDGKYDQDWSDAKGGKPIMRPGLISLAKTFASWKVPVMIRFYKEFTDDQIDLCVYGTDHPSQDPQKYGPEFVAAWQHVVNVFKENGATNVQWIWGPSQNLFSGAGGKPDDSTWRYFYPGNAYVDWIGGDNYNKSNTVIADYNTDPDIMNWYQIASKIGKPLMQSETGAGYNPKLNPDPQTEWLTSAYNSIQTEFPAIKAFVYWDDPGQGDYILQGNGLAEFKTIANDPYFEAATSTVSDYFSSTGATTSAGT